MGLSILNKLGSLGKLSEAISASISGPLGSNVSIPIAVDFGVRSIKVLQLASGDPPTLVAAAAIETPDHLINDHARRLEHQLHALPKIFKQGGFKGKRVACAIPGWMTQLRTLTLPRGEGLPLEAQVQAAIAAQLNTDPSSMVYRYFPFPGPGGRTDVLLISVNRTDVERFMRAVNAAKCDLVGLHNEFAALVAAHPPSAAPSVDAAACTMIVDLGANACRVAFAHGKDLEFARTVAVGGRRLDEMVARQLSVDLNEAHRQRMGIADFGATGELCTREDGAVITGMDLAEPLAILGDELEMCLRFFTSQHAGRRVRDVVFFGGEAQHTALCHFVARKLRLTAHVGDPCARFAKTGKEPCTGVDLKQPQPGWAVAVGLCLCPTDL